MKKCPYCAEEIQDESIKCCYCEGILDPVSSPLQRTVVKTSNKERRGTYSNNWLTKLRERENNYFDALPIGLAVILCLLSITFSQEENCNTKEEPLPATAPKVETPVACRTIKAKTSLRKITHEADRQLKKNNVQAAKSFQTTVNQDKVSNINSLEQSKQKPIEKPASVEDVPQQNNKIEAIVLKNGDIIKGQILSINADIVKIRNTDGEIMSYSFEREVERFIKE